MRTLLLWCCATWTAPAFAAGWTQPEGDVYAKVWNRLLIGDRAYFANGETGPLPGSFVDTAVGFYVEYGLVEGTTLIVHGTPIGWARYRADSDTVGAFGVVEDETLYVGPLNVGVRRALYQGEGLVLAAELQVGFAPPIGDETIGAGSLDAADCTADVTCAFTYRPATEHARVGAELQIGVPLASGWWLSGSAGWMNMASITHVAKASAQVGWASSFGLVIDVHATLHQPLDEVEANDVAGSGVTQYVGFGPAISYWLSDHFGVNVGAEGVIVAKSNLATPTLTLGLEFK